jgi:chlorite dismutase
VCSSYLEEQRRLVQWSCFYDSIYENPESPTDEIIEDDDLLDGWVLKQRREREADKEKQFGQNILKGKNEKADEMFIVVGNQEDAAKVYKMNSNESKMIQKSRLNAVLKAGEIKESQLPDRKMEIRQRLTQMESERFKR